VSGESTAPELRELPAEAVISQIVTFALLGQDAAGNAQLSLGLSLGSAGRLGLHVIALGDARVALRVRARDGRSPAMRRDIDELIVGIEARGVTVAEIEWVHD
jgi:hypothetical protein